MTLEFGEILQKGNFYHDNYRNAESKFTYISDGVLREIRPRFTFFGFRYVKVSGLGEIDPNCFMIISRVTEVWGRGFTYGKRQEIIEE